MSDKPLLGLDVDGPLNPYGAKPHRRPDGYQTYRYTRVGQWYAGKEAGRYKGIRVWLNPAHGPMLLSLADRFDLVWMTTWEDLANEFIGPAIGLPPLPVAKVNEGDDWKWPGVLGFAAGRPLAWIDDEHIVSTGPGSGRERFDAKRGGLPTLLHYVDPAIGLTADDISALSTWADQVREAS